MPNPFQVNKHFHHQQFAARLRAERAAEETARNAAQTDASPTSGPVSGAAAEAAVAQARPGADAPDRLREQKEDKVAYDQSQAAPAQPRTPALAPDDGPGPETGHGPTLATVAADEVETEALDWLWAGRFALGKLGMLIGDPDNGKSLLALDMAARVSHGRPWPDGTPCPAGDVLVVSGEDDAGDTIRPRLEAAGAELGRVHLFREVIGIASVASAPTRRFAPTSPASGGGEFALKRHLGALEKWLEEHMETRLVIFDPLSAATAGADAHRDAAVRGLLAPLAALAQRHGAAVIGIVHLNKRGGDKPIYRASGSLAFVAAARHVYVIGRDRCDPNRRLMARVKNNLSRDETGMVFEIVASAAGPPVLVWEPEPVEINAQGVIVGAETMTETRRNETEAQRWLADLLEDGPVPVTTLHGRAQRDDIPWRNVQRAKLRLGVFAIRTGFDEGSFWSWSLPSP